jgi:hypothetical protein
MTYRDWLGKCADDQRRDLEGYTGHLLNKNVVGGGSDGDPSSGLPPPLNRP